MNVFSPLGKLRDELFCMTEERNYFQAKYTEQVSEIKALKDELEQARAEIRRLREHVMNTSAAAAATRTTNASKSSSPRRLNESLSDITMEQDGGEEKKDCYGDCFTPQRGADTCEGDQPHQEEREIDDEEVDDDEDEELSIDVEEGQNAAIRQNAAKLLNWVDYRTSITPSKQTIPGSDYKEDCNGGARDIQEVGEMPLTGCNSNADDNETESVTGENQSSSDVEDANMQRLHCVYCEKLKQIHECSSAEKAILVQEATVLLQDMTREAEGLRNTPSKRDEWLERITLYKGQLRLVVF